MPDPAPELSAQLDTLMDEAGEAFDAGNAGYGHACLNDVWRMLPEPKTQWDYYSQSASNTGLAECTSAGLFDEAFVWLERARQAYAGSTTGLIEVMEVVLRYEAGTPDAAEVAAKVLADFGPKVFGHDDPKYLRFAQTGERAPGDSGRATPPAGPVGASTLDTAEIERLSEEGSDLLDDDWEAALAVWQRALALVPEPRTAHEEATWLYTSIGDAYHSGERWQDAVTSLEQALQCPGGTGNAYLWLRLGQSQYELGRTDDAANSLLSAYMLEGEEIFADEDPQYLALLSDRGLLQS